MSTRARAVDSDKIWACLITNASYLPGLLTLNFSLRRVGSKYPLVALHTGFLPDETLDALQRRDIPLQQVPFLFPGSSPEPEPSSPPPDFDGIISSSSSSQTNGTTATHHAKQASSSSSGSNTSNTTKGWYANDPRFRDCFTKLSVLSLEGSYARVVLLDADMLVLRNMDELFDSNTLELDENRKRVFAAVHACTCNPLRLKHYPRDWVKENCAFTALEKEMERWRGAENKVDKKLEREGKGKQGQQQQNDSGLELQRGDNSNDTYTSDDDDDDDDAAAAAGDDIPSQNDVPGMGMLNSGLLVLRPNKAVYKSIVDYLRSDRATAPNLPFAEQSLLGELFRGQWVALPWVYNGLKTMRWKEVHVGLWSDQEVKNIHFILTPKPWELNKKEVDALEDGPDRWWWEVDAERRRWEAERRIGRELNRINCS
ncbi:glycosyltransferase family 8 protein [Parathielavia appendiculata]|uniref:Glycosyltransferase family 8 protein n=1 Tax=Parathielavia appendiculata TaxID=2587402 RepID=A0AAN6TV36_9PEZI|nr:glycosyltransferase family 8 protein [Parathielavia appendiculata]